jgi:hypothetical protein
LRQREGGHAEPDAGQPERGRVADQGDQDAEQDGQQHPFGEADARVVAQDDGRVAAEPDVERVAERHQSGVAEHQVERDRGGRGDQHERQHLEAAGAVDRAGQQATHVSVREREQGEDQHQEAGAAVPEGA